MVENVQDDKCLGGIVKATVSTNRAIIYIDNSRAKAKPFRAGDAVNSHTALEAG